MQDRDMTIFIVEDDDADFIELRRVFQSVELHSPLLRASDGETALNMLLEGKIPSPFLVLLDLNIPKIHGMDVLKQVRANSALKDTTIFIMTSSSVDKYLCQDEDTKVSGFLEKGTSLSELTSAAETIKAFIEN